jgi:hypothetical protein
MLAVNVDRGDPDRPDRPVAFGDARGVSVPVAAVQRRWGRYVVDGDGARLV